MVERKDVKIAIAAAAIVAVGLGIGVGIGSEMGTKETSVASSLSTSTSSSGAGEWTGTAAYECPGDYAYYGAAGKVSFPPYGSGRYPSAACSFSRTIRPTHQRPMSICGIYHPTVARCTHL